MWELAEKNQKVRDHDGPYLGCIECSEESRPPRQLTSVPAAKESAFHKAIFHGSSLARIPKKWPAVLISTFSPPPPPDWHPRVGSRGVWRKYLHRSPRSKAAALDNDDLTLIAGLYCRASVQRLTGLRGLFLLARWRLQELWPAQKTKTILVHSAPWPLATETTTANRREHPEAF